jgi:SAM-dependent methyltransferase
MYKYIDTNVLSASAQLKSVPLPSRVDLFRLFTESGRLQVLALCAHEELSVSELALALADSQPQVSRKVAALREANLLDARKDGARLYLKLSSALLSSDAIVAEAVAEGRRLCLADGSLSRVPALVAAREASGVKLFEAPPVGSAQSVPSSPEHLAHLAALGLLFPQRALALDIGTGDGLLLDVLAPVYQRVIAVERSQAQLARVSERVAARGFHNVSLFSGSHDDVTLWQRVDDLGGADLVFAGRTLHHASRPQAAVQSFARLLKKGGHLVVLDYLPHDMEVLRTEHGDVWSGFSSQAMAELFESANLTLTGEIEIPAAFHPQGADASVQWHAWAASKPRQAS